MANNAIVRQNDLASYTQKIQTWVNDAINDASDKGTIFHLCGRKDTVEDLPTEAAAGDIYLVGPEDADHYDEYYLTEAGNWESMGTTQAEISFDGYVTEDALATTLADYAKSAAVDEEFKKYVTNEVMYGAESGGTADEPTDDSVLGQIFARLETIETDLANTITEAELDSMFADKTDTGTEEDLGEKS